MSEPKTVAEAVIRESGYWLPEDRVINLTAIELGALLAFLLDVKARGGGRFPLMKVGPRGEPSETTLIDRLIEKVSAEADRK